MSNTNDRRLLDRNQALALLQLPEDAFRWLLDTNQLTEIVIRGHSRFDSQQLYQLIDSYERTQSRRRNRN